MSAMEATAGSELRFARSRMQCGHWDRLHNLIRELFPVKTAAYLAEATGVSQRAAELSLRERRSFASDSLVALLDTEHGPQVLTTLLEHSKQPWVKEFKRLWQAERIKSEMALLQQQLDQLKIESL